MAYVKQTWSCGDEISAEKLNHMEDGIFSANSGGGTPLIVNVNMVDGTETLDKTWQEMADAFPNVYLFESLEIMGSTETTMYSLVYCSQSDEYYVEFYDETRNHEYSSTSASGYPTHVGGGE